MNEYAFKLKTSFKNEKIYKNAKDTRVVIVVVVNKNAFIFLMFSIFEKNKTI